MAGIDFTHDPFASSWVEGADGHANFPVQNLPLGVFSPFGAVQRGGVAIGDWILDVGEVAKLLDTEGRRAAMLASDPVLNRLLDAGLSALGALRHGLFELLVDRSYIEAVRPSLHRAIDCTMHLPVRVGDYTDFYAGIHHAENVGRLFRPDMPLLPNYKHVPIGYHGRASTVFPSGSQVHRPIGQIKLPDATEPIYAPCQRLDYELELGIWVAQGNAHGASIPITCASEHIAGFCLLNDWSARDIQTWEYQPLGPFLAKNFHTSVSPWIVTVQAMEPYRVAQPSRPDSDPQPLPYLHDEGDQARGAFDVTMEVFLHTERMRDADLMPHRLSRSSVRDMYWTAAQLVTHHTSNGCALAAGDLLGTGTLSGEIEGSEGSLLELSRGGSRAVALPGGEERGFLADGDEVVFTAFAECPGRVRIGFGECRGRIVSSQQGAMPSSKTGPGLPIN